VLDETSALAANLLGANERMGNMINRTHGRAWVSAMLAVALVCTSALPAAQDKGVADKAAKPQAQAGREGRPARNPVSDAVMAERLARYGEQARDPMALIVAARIKQEIGVRVTQRQKQTSGGVGEATKKSARDTSVAALVARAKALAKDRPDIVALADDVEKMRPRGRLEGPQVAIAVIRGGATDTYSVRFDGGALAAIGISGDGDADLDLFVVDEHGNQICKADGPGDDEICRFTPRTTGIFRVEVRNVGKVANQYLFITN
jgi:hypothetical protein